MFTFAEFIDALENATVQVVAINGGAMRVIGADAVMIALKALAARVQGETDNAQLATTEAATVDPQQAADAMNNMSESQRRAIEQYVAVNGTLPPAETQ